VTLNELLRLLYRYRVMFVFCILLGVAGGAALSVWRVPLTEYQTVLRIGHYVGGGTVLRLLQTPSAAVSEIRNAWIPAVEDGHSHSSKKSTSYGRIQVTSPDSSNILILRAACSAGSERECRTMLNDVAQRAIQKQNRVFVSLQAPVKAALQRAKIALSRFENNEIYDAKRTEVEQGIDYAKRRLADTQEKTGLLKAQVVDVEKREVLARARARQIRTEIQAALRDRVHVAHESGGPGAGVLLMAADSDIRGLQGRLANLEERLKVDLPGKRYELLQQLVRNDRTQSARRAAIATARNNLLLFELKWQRSMAVQRQRVAGLVAQVEQFEPSKLVMAPTGSGKTLGAPRWAIVSLGGMLGLLVAGVLAFARDLIRYLRASEIAASDE
jgi:hypothetical protein